MTDDGLNNV